MDAADLARMADDFPHVYPCVGVPERVPVEVRQAGHHARHCLVQGYFGVQFWWQASDDCVNWWFVVRTG